MSHHQQARYPAFAPLSSMAFNPVSRVESRDKPVIIPAKYLSERQGLMSSLNEYHNSTTKNLFSLQSKVRQLGSAGSSSPSKTNEVIKSLTDMLSTNNRLYHEVFAKTDEILKKQMHTQKTQKEFIANLDSSISKLRTMPSRQSSERANYAIRQESIGRATDVASDKLRRVLKAVGIPDLDVEGVAKKEPIQVELEVKKVLQLSSASRGLATNDALRKATLISQPKQNTDRAQSLEQELEQRRSQIEQMSRSDDEKTRKFAEEQRVLRQMNSELQNELIRLQNEVSKQNDRYAELEHEFNQLKSELAAANDRERKLTVEADKRQKADVNDQAKEFEKRLGALKLEHATKLAELTKREESYKSTINDQKQQLESMSSTADEYKSYKSQLSSAMQARTDDNALIESLQREVQTYKTEIAAQVEHIKQRESKHRDEIALLNARMGAGRDEVETTWQRIDQERQESASKLESQIEALSNELAKSKTQNSEQLKAHEIFEKDHRAAASLLENVIEDLKNKMSKQEIDHSKELIDVKKEYEERNATGTKYLLDLESKMTTLEEQMSAKIRDREEEIDTLNAEKDMYRQNEEFLSSELDKLRQDKSYADAEVQKYKELTSDRQSLLQEIDFLRSQVGTKDTELQKSYDIEASLKQTIQSVEQQMADTTRKLFESESLISTTRLEYQALQGQSANFDSQHAELKSKIASLEADKAAIQDTSSALEDRVKSLESQLKQSEEAKTAIDAKLNAVQIEAVETKAELDSRLWSMENRADNADEALKKSTQSLSEATDKIARLESLRDDLQHKLEAAQEQVRIFDVSKSTIESSLNELTSKSQTTDAAYSELQSKFDQLTNQFKAQKEEKAQLETTLSDVQTKFAQVNTAHQDVGQSLSGVQDKLRVVEESAIIKDRELQQLRSDNEHLASVKQAIEEKLKLVEAKLEVSSQDMSVSQDAALMLVDTRRELEKLTLRYADVVDERDSLSSSTRNLENNFVAFKQTYTDQLKESKQSLELKLKELKEVQEQLVERDATIMQLKGQLEASEQKVSQALQANQEMSSQIETMQSDLSAAFKNLDAQKYQFDEEKAQLVSQHSTTQESTRLAEHDELSRLKEALDLKVTQLAVREETLVHTEDDINKKLVIIEHDKKETEELQKALWAEKEFIDEKNEVILKLEAKIQELEGTESAAQQNIKDLLLKIEQLTSKEEKKDTPPKRGSGVMINILSDALYPTSDLDKADAEVLHSDDFRKPHSTLVSSFEMDEGDATSADFDQNTGVLLGVSPKNSADHNAPEATLKELARLRKDLATAERIRKNAYDVENKQINKISELEIEVKEKQAVLSKVASEKAAIENLLYTFAVEKKVQITYLKSEILRIEELSRVEREQLTRKNDENMRDELSKLENFLKTKNEVLSSRTDSDYKREPDVANYFSVNPTYSTPTYEVETGDIGRASDDQIPFHGKVLQERETRHGGLVETINIQPNEDQVPFKGKLLYQADGENMNYRSEIVRTGVTTNEATTENVPNPANNPPLNKKSSMDEWMESDDEDKKRYDEHSDEEPEVNDQDLAAMQQSLVFDSKAVYESQNDNTNDLAKPSQSNNEGMALTLKTGMPKFADSDVILVTSSRSEPPRQTFYKNDTGSAKMGESDAWKKSPGKQSPGKYSSRDADWQSKGKVTDLYVKKETKSPMLESRKDDRDFEYNKKPKHQKSFQDSEYEPKSKTYQEGMMKSESTKELGSKRYHRERKYRDDEPEFYVKKDTPTASPSQPAKEVLQKNKSEQNFLSGRGSEGGSMSSMRKSETAKEFQTSTKQQSVEQVSPVRHGNPIQETSYDKLEIKSPFLADIMDREQEYKKSDDEWTPVDKKVRLSEKDRLSESQRSSVTNPDNKSESIRSSLFESAKGLDSARLNVPLADPFDAPSEPGVIQDNSSKAGTGSALWSDILQEEDLDFEGDFDNMSRPSHDARVDSLQDTPTAELDSERSKRKKKSKKKVAENIDLMQILRK